MSKSRALLFFLSLVFSYSAFAAEWLMKLPYYTNENLVRSTLATAGHSVMYIEDLHFGGWYLVRTATEAVSVQEAYSLGGAGRAEWVEPNYRFRATGVQPSFLKVKNEWGKSADPVYRVLPAQPAGPDPMASRQWSLRDTGYLNVSNLRGNPRIVVAVIDTGVDYMHPDLNGHIWQNPGEAGALANNGIDDDKNGFIDDSIGWDFVENDNKPYDKTGGIFGGNPGHGTHCAGVIGADAGNSYGITGIASGVQIMPIRFLDDQGSGTAADAVKSVKYAVDNGAAILSNSWGGADDNDAPSRALREIFEVASTKGRLILAAAGNDSMDVDAQPMQSTPASYNLPNQITVAATTSSASLASYSNYGAKLVHIGAPGSDIYSTVPGGRFTTLSGTSMATPIAAGAAALFWSQRLDLDASAVRAAMLSTVAPTSGLKGRTMSGGRLNVETLVKKYTNYR